MPLLSGLSLVNEILQFIGVFVSFSIAYVSYRGFRRIGSSSLLRLTTAFLFLGFGFLVEAMVYLGQADAALEVSATTVVVGGLLLETTGYFFLAFSHAVDVMLSKKMGFALLLFPVISLSGTQLADTLSILSFYFVLYGVVETMYSYARTRKPETLLIAGGLALIGVGTIIQWLSILYLQVDVLSQVLLLLQVIMKEMGLLLLFTPVLNFAVRGVRIIDTV